MEADPLCLSRRIAEVARAATRDVPKIPHEEKHKRKARTGAPSTSDAEKDIALGSTLP
jgi:hypothetical protein